MPEESWSARDSAQRYGGGRVSGGADHDDGGGRALSLMRWAEPVAGDGPVGAVQGRPGEAPPAEDRGTLLEGGEGLVDRFRSGERRREIEQFTAAFANIRFVYLPLGSRS